MYLLIYSSLSRRIDALGGGTATRGVRRSRPMVASDRRPGQRAPCPTSSRPSADRQADEAGEGVGDGTEDRVQEVGRQDQEAQQQEDPVLLQELDDVLAGRREQDREQGRPVKGRDRQQAEHAARDVP